MQQLAAALADGVAKKDLQQSPHLVLVNKHFYAERLLPVLAPVSVPVRVSAAAPAA